MRTLLASLIVIPLHSMAADIPANQVNDCLDKLSDTAKLDCIHQLLAERKSSGTSEPPPKKKLVDVATLISDGYDPSYFGIASGLRLGSDQSPGNLLYEAQLAKQVQIHEFETTNFGNFRWDAPVRFVVRQLDVKSKPVRTPTFNAGMRLYQYAGPKADHYYSFGLFHYSNGQEGRPTTHEGIVNTLDGSFNTNYAEFAYGRRVNHLDSARVLFRQHFYGTWDDAQPNQYPHRYLEAQWVHRFGGSSDQLAATSMRTTLQYRWGYGYRVWNPVVPALDERVRFQDRFQLSIELLGGTLAKKMTTLDIFPYVRWDYGYDPYNINFQHRMNRIMLGLAAPL